MFACLCSGFSTSRPFRRDTGPHCGSAGSIPYFKVPCWLKATSYVDHQTSFCSLGLQGKSLQRIHRYNCWLSDLHKLGFYTSETASQTKVAIDNTPAKPATSGGKTEKKRSRMQVALKNMIRKTSTTCFSKTYAYESTESESETDRNDVSSTTSSCTSDEFGVLSADDETGCS